MNPPREQCPSCASPYRWWSNANGFSNGTSYRRHGRLLVAPNPVALAAPYSWRRGHRVGLARPTTNVRIRVSTNRAKRLQRGRWVCADPWHTRPDPEPLPARGRLGHNPDLTAAKAQLSRALQGKHRR